MASEGKGGELIPLQKYLFRGSANWFVGIHSCKMWSGWILDMYISHYEKTKPQWKQAIPANFFLSMSIN
jgi:hypothetical protein